MNVTDTVINATLIRYTFVFCVWYCRLTLEEKSSKSLSLARRADAALLANVGEAGWNAAAYLRADRATVAIINEGAMMVTGRRELVSMIIKIMRWETSKRQRGEESFLSTNQHSFGLLSPSMTSPQ